MKIKNVNVLGMPLVQWIYKSCRAEFGVGEDWATLYSIQSAEQSKGHATKLLMAAKEYYESIGKVFGGDVALNERMRSIYRRLKITEYQ